MSRSFHLPSRVAGPGAMTSIILLMGRVDGDFILQVIVVAVMLFVLGLCLVVFLFAIPLMERLGVTGINVVGRVFGIVLAALAGAHAGDSVPNGGVNPAESRGRR